MKYIRTYETEEKFLTDKDSTSRGFRLKPTLYKYSEAGDHVQLELDDPRKHEGSTWIRLEFTEATEFSFKISNVTGDDSNTLNYTIDWGDGTVETNTATRGDDKLYTFTHSYTIGTYDLELFGTDRSYRFVGKYTYPYKSYFSTPAAVKRVVVGGDVEVSYYTFYSCTSLTSINLPSTLTSIGYGAFNGCSSLTSINIPEGVTSIGVYMFRGCSSLTSINIPEGVTSIGVNAFQDCSSLTSINIPEGVTSIGNYTFYNCSSLTSINIPEGVTSIGDGAFAGCTSLTSIHVLASAPPALGDNVFEQSTLINFPKESSARYISSDWSLYNIGDIEVSEYNDLLYYFAENNTAVVYGYNHNSPISSVDIPSSIQHDSITYSVTSIRTSVFKGCSSLTSINIPEGVTSIGSSAFNGCSSLTSINIPEGVTSIGSSAFNGCSSLTSINIPEGVTSIGSSAFNGCSSLTSINIPEGVTSIGSSVFNGCSSLTSINIPEGVTSIGFFAFVGCTKLASISSYNSVAPTLDSIVFQSIPKNGTLHIKPGATGYDAWLSKLPEGWRIVEDL